MLRQSRLLQHGVRRVAGLDLAVDGEVAVANGAVPDLVVTSPLAMEGASGIGKNLLQLSLKASH